MISQCKWRAGKLQILQEFDTITVVLQKLYPPRLRNEVMPLMGAITNLSSVILPHRLLVVVNIENMKNENVLTQKDLELFERIVYKSADDIAVSIARSFERLEERIDAAESRIYSRLADISHEMAAELKTMRLYIEDASEVVIGEK